ncbi:MAG: xylulokinase [Spirochaetota bacterium]
MKASYILTHDVGTTGNKTCLYKVDEKITLIDSYLVEYPLYTFPNGGVEQNANEWWYAICKATQMVMKRSAIKPQKIEAMAYCAQMQGSVFIDVNGNALRNPMSYLDQRATEQIKRYLYKGLIKIEKWNAYKTIASLIITGGLAGTPKDPLWKYHWVRDNEPNIFEKAYKWLDVKDYLIFRCTDQLGMTQDSANVTFLYDTRKGKFGWHKGLCKMFNVKMEHLPPVFQSTDIIGTVTKKAAKQLGIADGIPVFGGGGDVPLTLVGSGCTNLYDTNFYVGTSGWVSSNVDKRMVDVGNFIASILGAIPNHYVYVAEQETAGACLKWVRDHLALDEIGVYLKKQHIADKSKEYESLYDYLNKVVEETPAGSGGIIFTPWLHGNRSPREDLYARGMFFNISLDSGKRQMICSVLEGVAFHIRWMLEAMEKKIPYQSVIRFAGGGAKSDIWCQIAADITQRTIEAIENEINAGTVGAAVVCAVGLGMLPSFSEAKRLVGIRKIFKPRPQYARMYTRNFNIFTQLYERNKELFKILNY